MTKPLIRNEILPPMPGAAVAGPTPHGRPAKASMQGCIVAAPTNREASAPAPASPDRPAPVPDSTTYQERQVATTLDKRASGTQAFSRAASGNIDIQAAIVRTITNQN